MIKRLHVFIILVKTMKNVTFSIGNLLLINKINDEYDYFSSVFNGIGGKAKDLVPCTKLFMYNRLHECFSINQIIPGYSIELFEKLGFSNSPKERSLYRNLERIGINFPFIMEQHQKFIEENKLVTDINYLDTSSSYFEGGAKNEFAEYGYSRDKKPNKKQLTFGICTGINGIPLALTIQKGNVQDKTHFRFMIKASEAVLEKNSLLVFDTGGNTKENKKLIREKEFNYLTLKAKKIGPYKKAIQIYNQEIKTEIEINKTKYSCIKYKNENEINYIFFSEKFKTEQLEHKKRKFIKTLEKNKITLKKTKEGKNINEFITEEGIITTKGDLQKILGKISNPNINGLEGFFILESSIDTDPLKILSLYKDKDKAEKLFRNIKEGTELRPIRHWNKNVIIGYILIIFLTNFLINLTLLRTKNPEVKNLKLLKKYLSKLTLAIIFDENNQKHEFLTNICPEIKSILEEYIEKYHKNIT